MFDNIGGKIKALAKVLFVLMVIGALVGALIGAINVGKVAAYSCGSHSYYSYSKDNAAGFFAGVGVFILAGGLGFLGAWIGSFFLYAFGQFVEDTERNREISERNERTLLDIKKQLEKGVKTDTQPEKIVKPIRTDDGKPTETRPAGPVVATVIDAGRLQCPVCGEVQPAGRNVCWNCGVRFEKETPEVEKTTVCPHCGQRQSVERRICLRCGKSLTEAPEPTPPTPPEPTPPAPTPPAPPAPKEWYCPNCGTKNEPDGSFCYLCGARKA